jgi:hypothetical protein
MGFLLLVGDIHEGPLRECAKHFTLVSDKQTELSLESERALLGYAKKLRKSLHLSQHIRNRFETSRIS